jgi:hypothetical protein
MRRSGRKEVPKIGVDALRDELFILLGAAMSAADVVNALRRFIEEIEMKGMLIGKHGGSDVIEKVDGTIRFEEV